MSTDPKSAHYDAGGIETLTILRAKLFPEQLEGYLLGNVLKYASRLNYKGDPQRDSEKLAIYATLLRDVMREHDAIGSEARDPQLHDGEPIEIVDADSLTMQADGTYEQPVQRPPDRPADGRPSIHNCPSGANCRNGCGLGPCPMESNE